MKHLDLHALIQSSKNDESPIDFYLKCDNNCSLRYTASALCVTEEDYDCRAYCAEDTIYAHNPEFETLLDFFSGSVVEFSFLYHILLNVVKKWEIGEEVVEEYILGLLLVEILVYESDEVLRVEDFVYEEDEINEEYLRGYSYYA